VADTQGLLVPQPIRPTWIWPDEDHDMPPSVSVIIVTWNGKSLLDASLSALRKQTDPNWQIIVVDNGSSDGTTDFVQDSFSGVEVVTLPKNLGFSRANNVGIGHARGEYIALLNNDAELAGRASCRDGG
jgi:GT2 family glycosyltransferase